MYLLWWVAIGTLVLLIPCWLWYRYWYGEMGPIICAVVVIFTFVALVSASIFNPIAAKQEVQQFIYTKEIVEQTIQSGNSTENFAITNSVLSMNSWLANAKSRKDVYGAFSMYYACDFSELEPIVLN